MGTLTSILWSSLAFAAPASAGVDDAWNEARRGIEAKKPVCETRVGDTRETEGAVWKVIGHVDEVFPGVGPEGEAKELGGPSSVPSGLPWHAIGLPRSVDQCGMVWEIEPTESLPSFDAEELQAIQLRTEAEEAGEGEAFYEGWEKSCGPDGRDHTIHDDEDRVEISSFNFRAQRAQVLVFAFKRVLTYPFYEPSTQLAGTCSGVLVDSNRKVLTNAHCSTIQGSNGDFVQPRNADTMLVCTRGNQGSVAQCSLAEQNIPNPAFYASGSTNGDVDQDFAVLTLENAIGGTNDWMTMHTSNSPSVWDDELLRQMAYHGYEIGFDYYSDWDGWESWPTCDGNVRTGTVSSFTDWWGNGDTVALFGRDLYRDTRPGSESNYSSNLVKTQTDGSKGSSGSPYFVCPNENCNAVPEIIGLHAVYYTGGTHRRRGPRVDRFRSFVNSIVP